MTKRLFNSQSVGPFLADYDFVSRPLKLDDLVGSEPEYGDLVDLWRFGTVESMAVKTR